MIRMHGTAIALKVAQAPLLCGFANRFGLLEVKVQIEFTDGPKPILSPVCMFLTDLRPEEHCEASLLASSDSYLDRVWHCLEIDQDGTLCRVTEASESGYL
jgi:hypothetical protein